VSSGPGSILSPRTGGMLLAELGLVERCLAAQREVERQLQWIGHIQLSSSPLSVTHKTP